MTTEYVFACLHSVGEACVYVHVCVCMRVDMASMCSWRACLNLRDFMLQIGIVYLMGTVLRAVLLISVISSLFTFNVPISWSFTHA